MTIRLRGHHLLCLLTYKGRGYTPDFTLNFNRIVRRLSRGESAVIVEGADDICRPMLCQSEFHCADDHTYEIDRQALADIGHLFGCDLTFGETIVFDAQNVKQLRQAFISGEIRTACQTCSWQTQCNDIAQDHFHNTRLIPPTAEGTRIAITQVM